MVLQQILQLGYFHRQAHLTCRVQLMQYYLCNFHLLQFSIRVFAFFAIGNWRQSRIYHHEHLSKREIVIQSSIFKLRNMGTAVELNVSKGQNLLTALLGLKVHHTYLISTHPLSTHFIDKPGSLISLDMMSVRHFSSYPHKPISR